MSREAEPLRLVEGDDDDKTPAPPAPPYRPENDGSSYGLYTLATLVCGSLSILIVQQADTKGARVWFAIQAAALYAGVIVATVFLFWRTWIRQLFEITPGWLSRLAHTYAPNVPWRLVRVIDIYMAINFAFSLLYMVFWVWDPSPTKNTYYIFEPGLDVTNPWAVWIVFINASFSIYNSACADFVLNRNSIMGVVSLHVIIADPIKLFVQVIVVSEAFELVRKMRQQAMGDGGDEGHEGDTRRRNRRVVASSAGFL